jgi:hypothetical protein
VLANFAKVHAPFIVLIHFHLCLWGHCKLINHNIFDTIQ